MNNLNGGYTMVDCTGIELNTAEKQTITGIRAQVDKAYAANKPIYAYNLTWNSLKATPIQIMLTVEDNNLIGTASTLQLIIDKADGVTINNMAPSNRTASKKKEA